MGLSLCGSAISSVVQSVSWRLVVGLIGWEGGRLLVGLSLSLSLGWLVSRSVGE